MGADGYGWSGFRSGRRALWIAALALAGPAACGDRAEPTAPPPAPGSLPEISSQPLPERPPGSGFTRLEAEATGIDFVHVWRPEAEFQYRIGNATAGGGVAIGDADGDGLPDVYLTRPHGGSRLYRNLGGMRFEDVTAKSGLDDDGAWSTGAAFTDVDNDGDLDLHVSGYDVPNRLYVNRGNGRFDEVGREAGIGFRGASIAMVFADYDRDGDVDGYLVTNRYQAEDPVQLEIFKRSGWQEVPEDLREQVEFQTRPGGHRELIQSGQYDHLYRNEGDGTFTEVTDEAGIDGAHHGLSASWWDPDADGWPDLYVANDFYGPDRFYRNQRDGSFTDGVREAFPHVPWFSMGTDVADVDNDGRFDLLGTDMASRDHYTQKLTMGQMGENTWFLTYSDPLQYMRNVLFLNTGTGRFMEVAALAGVDESNWTWAVRFGDFDEDGKVDLFVANGMTRYWFNDDLRRRATQAGSWQTEEGRRILLESPKRREANLAFVNRGDLRFEEVGAEWGLDHVGVSFGAALGDLDADGDLDLVVNNFEEPPGVYRNDFSEGHRAVLRLVGRQSPRDGTGATVFAETGAGLIARQLFPSSGFMTSNEPVVHLGLGDASRIERLEIRWPSGVVQSFRDVEADRIYTIVEPETAAPPAATDGTPQPWFEEAGAPAFEHQEREFHDFARQPLLPHRLSQLGPGMAWGDVDGDGDDDLYVAGAAGQEGALLIRGDDGAFERREVEAFDAASEEMSPLFLDADRDGDLDLFVTSGSVEHGEGSSRYRDTLYLGDGSGGFSRPADGALPDAVDSSGVAAAADFDADGDLDLFVGGRSIPGAYPRSPTSRLLAAEDGHFRDVTDERAPGLARSGMVTSAVWSDADADGDPDLLVTYEWGPLRYWRNEGGRLVEATEEAGLAGSEGWWNGIAARDLDNDGDVDYVATNVGLNTPYEVPTQLYFGDFEGTGKERIVEAEFEGDQLFPFRGRSCSSNAMPSLAERFPTFHEFAKATLPEIYSTEGLAGAEKFEANEFQSVVLLNDGSGRFERRPLPRRAQAFPGFGIVLTEVDGDGNPDLYLVGNSFSPQAEVGRMDGGLSLLALGRGDGSFEPVPPEQSGLLVPGDAKSLTATDLDDDGRVDFVVGVNDGPIRAFVNRGPGEGRVLALRLEGAPGNPTAVGARVTVHRPGGPPQTAEVAAGGGYLSQSGGTLHFGLGESGRVEKIEVRWPDGARTTHTLEPGTLSATLRRDA